MNIGALIIGDEILSGKRQDKHFAFLQRVLAQRELELSWTCIVGDDPFQLERMVRFSMSSDDVVFCFGGIGATPDDRTRQTVATVNQVELVPHPEALREIKRRYAESAYPNRIQMAYLPKGSQIIPNPVNRVPGFSFQHHHFMPGFPEMAWPMLEWVLDNRYPQLRNLRPATEQIIHIYKGRESDLLDAMNQLVADYPRLRLSSLPNLGDEPRIELSLRGDPAETEAAMAFMIQAVEQAGMRWHAVTSLAESETSPSK